MKACKLRAYSPLTYSLQVFAAIIAIFGISIGFSSCFDEITPTDTHTHKWADYNVWLTAPTCTKTGVGTRECETCKERDTDTFIIQPLGHFYGNDWTGIKTAPTCTEEGIGTKLCIRCSEPDTSTDTKVIPALGHDYGNWEEITAATCSTEGEEIGTCTRDETHTTTRPIRIAYNAPHKWSDDWEQVYAPTCTNPGRETRECVLNPMHSKDTRSIPALGHNWGEEWVQTTAPTCTTAGVKRQVCLRDSWVSLQTQPGDPALGHDWSEEWEQITAPTCTTAGRKRRACVRDPSHIDIQTGDPALDHNWSDWEQTTAPTFIAAGIKTRACLRDSSHKDPQTQPGDPPRSITSADDWTTARSQLSGKTGSYTLTISGNDIGVDFISFGTTSSGSLSVTLKGNGRLSATKAGDLISIGSNQTLVIDSENLTLAGYSGYSQNDGVTVNVSAGGKLELKNGTISGGYRGVNMSGTLIMSGGKISGKNGGGVYIPNAGTITMSNGEISGGSGNGVYMLGNGTITMSGGKISGGNVAAGGGVCMYSGKFIMDGGEISNSSATSRGGGVYVKTTNVDFPTTFTMNGGKISDNRASPDSGSNSYGGGVYVDERAIFTMNNGEISGNLASTYALSGGSYSSYGGGVYVNTNGTFTMKKGKISGNYLNATNNNGGGVCVYGTFNMENGEISDNGANSALNGGGVYVSGTFNMDGGKISDNAQSTVNSPQPCGMGVYMNSGTFTMKGGEISGNSHTVSNTIGYGDGIGYGGGVYVKNDNFRIVSGKIYDNIAKDGRELYIVGSPSTRVQYGTFTGTTWNGTNIPTISGSVSGTYISNNTIEVVNGVLK